MADRVRVTGPPRHVTARGTASRVGDVQEQTPLGDVFLSSLLREQFGLAARIIGIIAITLGLMPLAFHLFPDLADADLFGISLPWLALGVLVYPFLLLLAWRYVHRAERNEQVFADLVEAVHERGDNAES